MAFRDPGSVHACTCAALLAGLHRYVDVQSLQLLAACRYSALEVFAMLCVVQLRARELLATVIQLSYY